MFLISLNFKISITISFHAICNCTLLWLSSLSLLSVAFAFCFEFHISFLFSFLWFMILYFCNKILEFYFSSFSFCLFVPFFYSVLFLHFSFTSVKHTHTNQGFHFAYSLKTQLYGLFGQYIYVALCVCVCTSVCVHVFVGMCALFFSSLGNLFLMLQVLAIIKLFLFL